MIWFKKNKKTFGAIVFILIVIIGVAASGILVPKESVDAFKVSNGTVAETIKESGTVNANQKTLIYGNAQGEVKVIYFKEGDVVKKGDLILSTNEDAATFSIKSMREQAGALSIQLGQAVKLSAKSKILFQEGAISQTEYENIVAAEKQIQKQLSSLNYSIASASAGAQSGGIISPMDGVITELLIKENNTIQAGAPIIEISDLSKIYIATSLITADADIIKIGSQVIITRDDGFLIDDKAIVERIELKAHDEVSDLGISQKRVTVEIEPSTLEGLRLGSDVQLEIIANQLDNTLRVDNKALFEKDKKNYVFIINNNKAIETEVKLGLEGKEFSQIISGIKDGDMVIISPDNNIFNGTKVKLINQL
jgi:HlyD family secretion protein